MSKTFSHKIWMTNSKTDAELDQGHVRKAARASLEAQGVPSESIRPRADFQNECLWSAGDHGVPLGRMGEQCTFQFFLSRTKSLHSAVTIDGLNREFDKQLAAIKSKSKAKIEVPAGDQHLYPMFGGVTDVTRLRSSNTFQLSWFLARFWSRHGIVSSWGGIVARCREKILSAWLNS